MNENLPLFISVEEKHVINTKCIKWMKKMNDCIHICTHSNGCELKSDVHMVCNFNMPESYNTLNKYFTLRSQTNNKP